MTAIGHATVEPPAVDESDPAVLGASDDAGHEAYFRALLTRVDEPMALFGVTPQRGTGPPAQAWLVLTPEVARSVHVQVQRHGVRSASLFHLAWALALARISDRDDVVFGSMQSDASSLPFWVDVCAAGVEAALREVDRRRDESIRHAEAAPALARRCSAAARDRSLFNTQLDCSPFKTGGSPRRRASALSDASAHPDSPPACAVSMTVEVDDSGFRLTAQAWSPLNPQRLCSYLASAVQEVVQALAHAPAGKLGDLDAMPADERRLLLVEWNATDAPAMRSTTVRGLLEARAAAAPHAIALTDGELVLTHAELHARADRLATHLRRAGVGPDVCVAVCMERGAALVVGVLAVLKAGGAYLPLDPSYPVERLAYFVADSAPMVLLTQARVPAAVREALGAHLVGRTVIELDDAGGTLYEASFVTRAEASDPEIADALPDALAYVAYTSGSTGQPKGVANTVGGLANRLAWFAGAIADEPPVTALKTSIGFVDSLTEMLQTLVAGGRLVVFDAATAKDPRRFAQQVQRRGVSMLVVVPSLLRQLLDVDADALATVRLLVCSGERLDPALALGVRARLPGARLLNFYGSSEVNGDATFHDSSADAGVPSDASPIGRPIANTRIYLLDSRRRPVPIGATGELFVGGHGLARGYLGRADLSAERFLEDPFVPSGRMYKSGDLARWREDGVLEFIGRADHQVKLRGFRVELGEIEAAIGSLPQVRGVVVVLREDLPGDPRLVAYLAIDGSGADAIDVVRQRLRAGLPDFMMPAHFVVLDTFPLTPSGKLDRRSLPAPSDAVRVCAGELVMPRDEVETAVWGLWQELLRVDRFGVFDNFFETGGNSLLLVRLQSRLQVRFDTVLSLNALLQAPTVAGMAEPLRGRPAAQPTLVTIRPGAGGTPVFFVHDGFGETLVYRALAQRLDPDVPVYGLCPLVAQGGGMTLTRIRDMAAHHVRCVLSVRPEGPWVLAGLCTGGTIAFEMAQQLERQAMGPCTLVLIDANDVAARRRVGRFALGEARRHWSELKRTLSGSAPPASLGFVLRYVGKLVRLGAFQLGARAALWRGELRVKSLQRRLDRGSPPPPGGHWPSIDEICSHAEREHVVQGRLASEVVLVRATQGNGEPGDEPFAALYSDPLFGWAQRVSGPIRAIDVRGGHYSMFQPPHVQALADVLRSSIRPDAREASPGTSSGPRICAP